MNIRKIKLALTVGLINKSSQFTALQTIRELMHNLREDVGEFIEEKLISRNNLDRDHEGSNYHLTFEKCTLVLDLVSHKITKQQYLNNFQVR